MKKVVSGGQTGVDRAALDAAKKLDIEIGGWCPRGRLAEDGRIVDIYPLSETPSEDYAQRTTWNVRDSDGTLVLFRDAYSGGTMLTVKLARESGKPVYENDLCAGESVDRIIRWIDRNHIRTLNIAGPRESESPSIYREALQKLEVLFFAWTTAGD